MAADISVTINPPAQIGVTIADGIPQHAATHAPEGSDSLSAYYVTGSVVRPSETGQFVGTGQTGFYTGVFYPYSANPNGYVQGAVVRPSNTGGFLDTGSSQTINSLKNFLVRPTVSGTEVLLSGEAISSAQTGQFVGTGSTGSFVTGSVVRPSETGNFIVASQTGAFVGTGQTGFYTGVFYPYSANPNGYVQGAVVRPSNTGNFVDRTSVQTISNKHFTTTSFVNSANVTGIIIIGLSAGNYTEDALIVFKDPLSEQISYIAGGGSDGNLSLTTPNGSILLNGPVQGLQYAIFNSGVSGNNLVYNVSNQTISGVKNFASRPTVNGTGVLLSGEASVTGALTGAFYPLNSNPSGYITGVDLSSYVTKSSTGAFVTTGQTGQFITASQTGAFVAATNTGVFLTTGAADSRYALQSATGNFITTSQTGAFYPSSNPSGFLTGVDLSSYVTTGQTGQFVTGSVVRPSETGVFVTSSQTGQFVWTGATGSFLTTGAADGRYVSLTGNQDISGLKDFQTRPTVTDIPVLISGDPVDIVHLYGKNDQGTTIYRGQPVYIAGANGANPLIKIASNTGEFSSSKTIGLLAQDLLVNEFGYVVTEGALEGFDTSSGNAGDPMWLGPTGNILYGTGNKPYGNNHLVYLGIVLRSQLNNGKVYVKVQNGFEINELHRVYAQNPNNKDTLIYDSGSGSWFSRQISTGDVSGISAYALTANTGSFITTGQTGQFVGTGSTGSFVVSSATGAFLTTGAADGRYYSLSNGESISGFATTGFNNAITGMTITGDATKFITLFQRDGATVTGSFADNAGTGGGGGTGSISVNDSNLIISISIFA